MKSIEASVEGVENQQRIYIPIIGLEGKMSTFENDTQINVWHLHDENAIGRTIRWFLLMMILVME